MRDAVIVDAVRTPIGRRKGGLAEIHPVDLSAHVLRRSPTAPASTRRWSTTSSGVACRQVGEQAGNIARNARARRRLAGVGAGHHRRPAVRLQPAGGALRRGAVISGQVDIVVAGGVESMTRVPMGSARRGCRQPGTASDTGPSTVRDDSAAVQPGRRRRDDRRPWGLSRSRLDEYALAQHENAAAAQDAGAFDGQICAGADCRRRHRHRRRGHPPRTATLESLGGLKTAFRDDGVITAGNCLADLRRRGRLAGDVQRDRAAAHGLTPLARVHTAVVAADDPVIMLTGPIPATAKALHRSGLCIDDIGAFEVNEAFAPVPLAWQAETGADAGAAEPASAARSRSATRSAGPVRG